MEEWMGELSIASSSSAAARKKILNDASSSHSSEESQPRAPAVANPSESPAAPAAPWAILNSEEISKTMPILNFLESFTDCVIAGDSAGIIIAVNSAATKMFGYTAEEMKGQSLKILMPEPYRSRHDGYMFRHEKFGDEKLIGKTRALSGQKKNGEVFAIQISLGKLPVKGYFIATLREYENEPEDRD